MANRYWIGGTGNWNDAAHWSATSGGTGGASVPTAADNVTFDANSGTGTVTVNAVANMLDCTFTQTQLITLANAAYAFNIFGNWTLCSNAYLVTSFTGTGYVYLKATTSVNITTNGCTRGWNYLYFDGVGGTWTNQDDWNFGITQIFFQKGTYNTGNKNITGYLWWQNGGSIILGSSYIILNNGTLNNGNCIVDAGTSTIENKGDYFNGGGKTYNSIICSKYGDSILVGNFICNNLTIATSGGSKPISNFITVNNILTLTGNNASNYRLLIASSTIGTPRTITCNGTITASNVDFRDIVGAGTANWDLSNITGGSGDCGGNSGITFTPSQTQYFKHTLDTVNWSDVTKWFSNYERTIAGRVPLPQDDAIFDEHSFTGASTLTMNVTRIGRSCDMSGINVSLMFLFSNNQNVDIYGSLKFSSTCGNWAVVGMRVNFLARGSYVIDQKNVGIYGHVIGTPTSDYTVVSEIYALEVFAVNAGIFRLNGYNINVAYASNTYYLFNGGTVYAGTGTIYMNRGNVGVNILAACNFIPESSTLKFSPSSSSSNIRLNINGKTLNKIWFSGTHTGNFDISGNNTVAELIIDAGRKVRFTNGTTNNIGKLTAIGIPEQPITIGSTTAGQRHTLNYTGNEASTVEYCNISDSKVTEARRLLAKNSVNAGNNQNWGFDILPALALNKKQVDKIYVGDKLVTAIYKGTNKIY